MRVEHLLITPKEAKEFMSKNTLNRRLKQPRINLYANDILNGRWKMETGEMIKISKTDRVLDGQHRLLAIIKANLPMYFHVAFDLEDSIFDVLDTGTPRTASDVFKIKGVKNENKIPSIISVYNQLKSGKRNIKQKDEKVSSTNQMVLNQYLMDEEFWQRICAISGSLYLSFAKILSPSTIGGTYAFFYEKDEEQTATFFRQLCLGSDITNETINILRNKLIQDKLAVRKLPTDIKLAFIIKTWNCFRLNKELKVLKFDTVRDEFPIAI
jgi:hypothetical protein